MQERARSVAAGNCVWFIGSGFSYEADYPSAQTLAVSMLERALTHPDSPWAGDGRVQLWERVKQLLVGAHYEDNSELTKLTTTDEVLSEWEHVKRAVKRDSKNVPVWADRLTQLSRVAEVLQRAVPNPDQATVQLAWLMGFAPDHRKPRRFGTTPAPRSFPAGPPDPPRAACRTVPGGSDAVCRSVERGLCGPRHHRSAVAGLAWGAVGPRPG